MKKGKVTKLMSGTLASPSDFYGDKIREVRRSLTFLACFKDAQDADETARYILKAESLCRGDMELECQILHRMFRHLPDRKLESFEQCKFKPKSEVG